MDRTMKIDGYNSGAIQGQADRTDVTAGRGAREADSSASVGGDHLRLSGDLQLAQAATAAAQQAPEIRPDVVADMRAQLDAGNIGNDAGRLADALLDSWIQTP
jgi:flagellar biosynthesis anti-sigma factor FlgM